MMVVRFTEVRGIIELLEKGDSQQYSKCQWGRRRSEVSVVFLIYKWFHFVLLTICLLFSLLQHTLHPEKWLIYFTHWALILYYTQALFGSFIVANAYYSTKKRKPLKQPIILLKIYGMLHSCAIAIAFTVTCIFWSFIYRPDIWKMDLVNISSHVCNSIIMLVDLILVAHPVKLVDIVVPLLMVSSYAVFSLVYFFCGGTNPKGNPYVYRVLDWRRPVPAVLFILGGIILLTIIYICIWIVSVFKRVVSKRYEEVPSSEERF